MSNAVINTNVLALNSHRNMGLVSTRQAKASQRLSSGFRVNSAADDAAGLAISEKMRAQIRGLDQASRNSQDGISLIQTAEGALNTVNDMLIRIREITNQAANDTNTGVGATGGSDRGQIAREIKELQDEINAMSTRIEFNTLTLFDGTLSGGPNVFTSIQNATVAADGILTAEDAQEFIELTENLGKIGEFFGIVIPPPPTGAELTLIQNVLTAIENFANASTAANVALLNGALTAAGASFPAATANVLFEATGGMWVGTNPPANAAEAQDLIDYHAMAQRFMNAFGAEGAGVWFQVGANAGHGLQIRIDVDLGAVADGLDNVYETINTMPNLNGELISNLLDEIDLLLEETNNQRAQLGAWQNRLEFTIENLDLASENLSAANSRIRDADMALEMMRFTQANVLQQAAISMLAQANQAPQAVLSLLR